ncbi:hypothetical protein BN2476_1780006 [Paraburkholderia piptadeniae]|uniref:Uncharacterized protein n=1 Tax=Paraburkholderia piptadeniae TaxID=1701573 RepID=A0A1N7SYL9_9BURK|nr:hypothetical protein BN2476_1780006 [Paraburkholderia piptadeniae]
MGQGAVAADGGARCFIGRLKPGWGAVDRALASSAEQDTHNGGTRGKIWLSTGSTHGGAGSVTCGAAWCCGCSRRCSSLAARSR